MLAAEARYGSYTKRIINEQFYFKPGVAFTKIGTSFDARMHRYRSVIDVAGSSVFPRDAVDVAKLLCLMNSPLGRFVLQSLNPTVNFQVGDVSRLPVFSVEQADVVVDNIESAFAEHERGCESDLAFKSPRPSPWTHAQAWAQAAVARPEGSPLPKFTPACDPVAPETIVSWTIGVALGRFGPSDEGVLDVAPVGALPNGILFVSSEGADSLDHAACAPIVNAWKEHGAAVGQGDDLRTYLRTSYFALHKRLYETRPIYFPLTSKGKNFVGLVSIHRWADDSLSVLLADHLLPIKKRLEGELDDLRTAKAAENGVAGARAERRFGEVKRLLEELNDFIAKVTEIAERGPPPSDDKLSLIHISEPTRPY